MKLKSSIYSPTNPPEAMPWLRMAVGGLLLILAGCTHMGAKPWQRDLMAQQAMQVDAYPLETSMDEHVYFSKEASSGGRGFAGGGCGCN